MSKILTLIFQLPEKRYRRERLRNGSTCTSDPLATRYFWYFGLGNQRLGIIILKPLFGRSEGLSKSHRSKPSPLLKPSFSGGGHVHRSKEWWAVVRSTGAAFVPLTGIYIFTKDHILFRVKKQINSIQAPHKSQSLYSLI